MSLLGHLKRENLADPDEEVEDENQEHRSLKSKVHDQLLNRIDVEKLEELDQEQQEEEVYDDVAETFDELVSQGKYSISRKERDELIDEIIDEIIGLGPLQSLVGRDDITEIMVNGPEDVYIETDEGVKTTDITFNDKEHLMNIIHKIVRPLGRRVDESQPYVDARLPDGSRVNIIIPPLVTEGPHITIREFKEDPLTIEDLIDYETMTSKMADFFEACVKSKLNILISGGTGSGKTTTLNCFSGFIPPDERILTIEDTLELQLQQPHVVSCESRPPNIEGEGEVTIRDLVKNSLRMRPDRIIVGECRGPEALDMLQAMNTGHEGSMTTIHSNGTREAIGRLETLVMMAEMELPQQVIRGQIASAIHIILQQDRMQDGTRKITKVSEVTGIEGNKVQLSDIFVFEQQEFRDEKVIGRHKATGVRPSFHEKFERKGITLPDDIYIDSL